MDGIRIGYIAPAFRDIILVPAFQFCRSEIQDGRTDGRPEDVGYDDWLDGLE